MLVCVHKRCVKKKNLLKKDVIMINVYNDLMEDTEQTACFYASLFLGLAKQDDTIWQFFIFGKNQGKCTSCFQSP